MYKKSIVIFNLFISLFFTACAKDINVEQYVVHHHKANTIEEDFRFDLISEKEQYHEAEKVHLYGEITYIGDQESVDIVHASSPVTFMITEAERQLDIEYTVQDIGETTTLKRNEPLRIPFEKSNTFIEEDPNFFDQFMDVDYFPIGYYEVEGMTHFSLFEPSQAEDATLYRLNATIDFKVTH